MSQCITSFQLRGLKTTLGGCININPIAMKTQKSSQSNCNENTKMPLSAIGMNTQRNGIHSMSLWEKIKTERNLDLV